MSVRITTSMKSKHLTFRVNVSRYSMLKEYSLAHEMSISDTINAGLDLLFNNVSPFSKKENNDGLDHIFKALNDLNSKVNELTINQKLTSAKKPPHFFICSDEKISTLISQYYKRFVCYLTSITVENINKLTESPYHYHFVVIVTPEYSEILNQTDLSKYTLIMLEPANSDDEKIQKIKSTLEVSSGFQ